MTVSLQKKSVNFTKDGIVIPWDAMSILDCALESAGYVAEDNFHFFNTFPQNGSSSDTLANEAALSWRNIADKWSNLRDYIAECEEAAEIFGG